MENPEKLGPIIGYGGSAEIFAWGDDQVLKLFHEDAQAADVEEEARIVRLVGDMGLPVPDVFGTVEAKGRLGIIYERLDGPTILQRFSRAPWSVHSLTKALAELHLLIHQHRVSDLPSQREKMVVSVQNAPSVPAMMKESALQALERLPDDDFLCHGDFHPDQIIMSQRGPVIIDWITATKGSPAADVARSSLILRLFAPDAARASERLVNLARTYAHSRYMKRYLKTSSTRQAIDEWQIPVAVSLLGTGIPEVVKSRLLALVEGLMHRDHV